MGKFSSFCQWMVLINSIPCIYNLIWLRRHQYIIISKFLRRIRLLSFVTHKIYERINNLLKIWISWKAPNVFTFYHSKEYGERMLRVWIKLLIFWDWRAVEHSAWFPLLESLKNPFSPHAAPRILHDDCVNVISNS